jgi:hypothetical protein
MISDLKVLDCTCEVIQGQQDRGLFVQD